MPYQNYWTGLLGEIPRLDPLKAQNIVQAAWRDICDERIWSWLVAESVLLAPQIVTTGSVTTTQFNNQVQADGPATTALTGLTQPLITSRQLRVGIGGGAIYNIAGFDSGTGIITLDRPFLEPGGASQQYQCYRCYYQPADMSGNLVTNFLDWIVILNAQDGYAITGENLRISRQEIDARDPTRGAQDLAYTACIYKTDANGMPIYELWPHPTSQRGYIAAYRMRNTVLSNTQDVPLSFPSNVLVERAKILAYDWAIANAGRFQELRGVDFTLLKAEVNRRYERNLQKAKVKDDELFCQDYIPNLRDYLTFPPLDSRFLQAHDAGGWFQG